MATFYFYNLRYSLGMLRAERKRGWVRWKGRRKAETKLENKYVHLLGISTEGRNTTITSAFPGLESFENHHYDVCQSLVWAPQRNRTNTHEKNKFLLRNYLMQFWEMASLKSVRQVAGWKLNWELMSQPWVQYCRSCWKVRQVSYVKVLRQNFIFSRNLWVLLLRLSTD